MEQEKTAREGLWAGEYLAHISEDKMQIWIPTNTPWENRYNAIQKG